MTQPKDPTLQQAFAALLDDQEALQRRANQVDLQPPDQWHSEHATMRALLAESHEEPQEDRPSLMWLLRRLLQGPTPWAAALALVVTLGIWSQVHAPNAPASHKLLPKGGAGAKDAVVALQISTWQPKKRRLEPLQPGQTLRPTDSLVFGFQLSKQNGFIYVFHSRASEMEMIFPPPNQPQTARRPGPEVQLLQKTGTPQRYTLTEESGPQEFTLLLTRRRLLRAELQRWLKQSRPHRPLSKAIEAAQLQGVIVGSDRIKLRVEGAKR